MRTSNERAAQIVTILILASALGAAVLRQTQPGAWRPAMARQRDPTPQDAVYAMLDAARAGDVARYLASHTGQMEQSLRRAISESADFAQYLRDSDAALKGVAINEPQVLSDRVVKLRVEYVFLDRNELQVLYLGRTPDGWKISQVESAERIPTPAPYGAPVG